MYIKKLKIV